MQDLTSEMVKVKTCREQGDRYLAERNFTEARKSYQVAFSLLATLPSNKREVQEKIKEEINFLAKNFILCDRYGDGAIKIISTYTDWLQCFTVMSFITAYEDKIQEAQTQTNRKESILHNASVYPTEHDFLSNMCNLIDIFSCVPGLQIQNNDNFSRSAHGYYRLGCMNLKTGNSNVGITFAVDCFNKAIKALYAISPLGDKNYGTAVEWSIDMAIRSIEKNAILQAKEFLKQATFALEKISIRISADAQAKIKIEELMRICESGSRLQSNFSASFVHFCPHREKPQVSSGDEYLKDAEPRPSGSV